MNKGLIIKYYRALQWTAATNPASKLFFDSSKNEIKAWPFFKKVNYGFDVFLFAFPYWYEKEHVIAILTTMLATTRVFFFNEKAISNAI